MSFYQAARKSIVTREYFDGPHLWHNRTTFPQDAQKGQTSHPLNPGNYLTLPP